MVEYLAIFWQAKVCLEYVGIHAILMEDQHIRMTSPVGRFFGWFVRTERRRTSRHLFLQNGFWWTISNWLLISRIYSRNFCWPNSLEIWALPLPIKSHNCELNLYLWSLFGDFKGISTHIYIYMYMLHVPWAGVFFSTRWDGIESHWGLLVSLVWSQGLVIQGLMWPS